VSQPVKVVTDDAAFASDEAFAQRGSALVDEACDSPSPVARGVRQVLAKLAGSLEARRDTRATHAAHKSMAKPQSDLNRRGWGLRDHDFEEAGLH
jgi:hypothetical protein